MDNDATDSLSDLMIHGIAGLHEDGSITYTWDGVSGVKRDETTGITTLVTNVRKLPERGWRPAEIAAGQRRRYGGGHG